MQHRVRFTLEQFEVRERVKCDVSVTSTVAPDTKRDLLRHRPRRKIGGRRFAEFACDARLERDEIGVVGVRETASRVGGTRPVVRQRAG